MINEQIDESHMPYLLPNYQVAGAQNQGMLNNGQFNNGQFNDGLGANRKLTRAEKKQIKNQNKAQRKQQKALQKQQKQATKAAKKNKGANIGGGFLAPVAPREELFMGHPVINEVQKPGLATGYGIPEHGRAGSPLGSQYTSSFANPGLASNYSTYGNTTSSYGSTQHYTGAPSTTCYTDSNQCVGGASTIRQDVCYEQHAPASTVYVQQQPLIHQQPLIQQQHTQQHVTPVQIQGYYDGMILEQPHEKAGGFFAPFTGSFTNKGAGTTGGLQGQGKANFANTIASSVGAGGYGAGQGGQGLLGHGNNGIASNPLLNAPNLTYPVALENERLTGLASNKHAGLHLPGQKLSRKEKKAMKNGQLNNNGQIYNPEYNNAAIY